MCSTCAYPACTQVSEQLRKEPARNSSLRGRDCTATKQLTSNRSKYMLAPQKKPSNGLEMFCLLLRSCGQLIVAVHSQHTHLSTPSRYIHTMQRSPCIVHPSRCMPFLKQLAAESAYHSCNSPISACQVRYMLCGDESPPCSNASDAAGVVSACTAA